MTTISDILPPLHTDKELYGETGSYIVLAARCCPLAYLANVITYIGLSKNDRPNSVEVLEDQHTLLTVSSISAIVSIITAIALYALGITSPFIDVAFVLSFLTASLSSSSLHSLNLRTDRTMSEYFERNMDRLKKEQQIQLQDMERRLLSSFRKS